MKLRDRIRRWWNPAEWRDEHPQVTEGDDSSESDELEAERLSREEHSFNQDGTLGLGSRDRE
jgi:hypothetical protein